MAVARMVVPLVLLCLLPLVVKERRRAAFVSIADEPGPTRERMMGIGAEFLKNLLRVTIATLPWMLLAAVLGAIAAEMIPAYGTHMPVTVVGVVLVAVLGTVLPVPMAFDVGLAWVLYRAGVAPVYVATLLCTLGIVSVYSLTALGQQLGRAVALRLAGIVAALGSLAGAAIFFE